MAQFSWIRLLSSRRTSPRPNMIGNWQQSYPTSAMRLKPLVLTSCRQFMDVCGQGCEKFMEKGFVLQLYFRSLEAWDDARSTKLGRAIGLASQGSDDAELQQAMD